MMNRALHGLLKPAFGLIWITAFTSATLAQTGHWSFVSASPAVPIIPREECAFAQAGGKFYLLGGRGINPVQEFTPSTKTWKNLKNTPTIFNHFQALTYCGLIYVIGAFDESLSGFPKETPAPNIYIYDPLSDTWIKGPPIPAERQRGSAGLVEYQGKFYVVLGNKLGHTAAGVVFLDEFDPATNAWTPLADAPRSRDHFQAVALNGKLYAMGGRQSANPGAAIFTDLEKVDVYDFAKASWSTLPSPASDMKVKRSGGILAAMGDEILFAGGSNPNVLTTAPYNLTDAFNTLTNTWRSLAPLNTARQVAGGFVNNSGFYVASGSGGTGGSPTLATMEAFFLGDSLAPGGDALAPGQLAPTESPFNFGIAASGQKSDRSIQLRNGAGSQGVLIGNIQVTGDGAYKIKSAPIYPLLVRPGGTFTLDLEFTSSGTVPAAASLDVTLAVPKGVVVKIPLEANKTALGLSSLAHPSLSAPGSVSRFWRHGWLFGTPEKAADPKGRDLPLLPPR